jgi:cobalt-zinc-cadmium efflux system membrane fusion protein
MKEAHASPSSSISKATDHPEENKPQNVRRPWIPILAVALIVAAAVAYRQLSHSHQAIEKPPESLTVAKGIVTITKDAPQWDYLSFDKAIEQQALPPLPAPARVTVDERKAQPIFSQLPGRIERVMVQLGESVKAGTPLLSIRSTSLPDLKRDADLARSSVVLKQATVDRLKDLVALKAVPEKELLSAEQELNEAHLALTTSGGKQKALRLGGLDGSGLFMIRADGPGTVVERHALVGMEVGPEKDEPLVFLAQLDEVVVIADLVDSEAQLVSLGATASIRLSGNNTDAFEGKVEYVGRLVDPLRHTVAVRIRVDNKNGKLRPNAFARVIFPPASHQLVVVPSEAVVTDDDKSVVFVKQSESGGSTTIHKRTVQLGRSRDGKVELLSGLQAGETYVSKGALLILNAIDLAE